MLLLKVTAGFGVPQWLLVKLVTQRPSQEFLMEVVLGQNGPKKRRGGGRGFGTQCYFPSHGGFKPPNHPLVTPLPGTVM
jgi:hypothetical protein